MQKFTIKNATVTYNEGLQCIEVIHKGYLQKEDFRALWSTALDLACKHRCFNWLLNHREMATLAQENFKWILEEWYPRMKQVLPGVRHVATIPPKDGFGQLLSRQMLLELGKDVAFIGNSFNSIEEARQWLVLEQESQLQVA